MRMRKKKYLDERLEAVSQILYIADFEERNFNTAIKEKEYLDLKAWFGNSNPVFLEIGCGKGRFAREFAKKNPNINLLAVEKSGNVIVGACEQAKREKLQNVKFLKCSAEYLEKFLKEKSIARIFLNFSCPFPKAGYATHRLTHQRFLEIYKRILIDGGEIHQKTDNMKLFEFSLEQLSSGGFEFKNVTLDLHNSGFDDNIMTEYEEKFVSQGLPIYRLEAVARK